VSVDRWAGPDGTYGMRPFAFRRHSGYGNTLVTRAHGVRMPEDGTAATPNCISRGPGYLSHYPSAEIAAACYEAYVVWISLPQADYRYGRS
jgi:hypothetical protein